ncbi:MAG TPA: serine hydrolase [Xanthobacteraceae bacterium]|nr:serine hydrolase [Xanthobacteraceae bacterium]
MGLALWLSVLARPAAAGPYILIDADSGRVLAHSEAGQPWYPASISKLMTTFVVLRAVRDGRVKPDTLLTVSETAAAQDPSKMGFPVGTQVSVDNAIKMLLVKSANDIAVVLAEGVGGSLPAFVAEMNRTAAELGMTATHYNNPNGLPDDGQITSARDMAILARQIYREFPEQEMIFRIPALKFGKRILANHNRLIDHFVGATGMKTGFICASGFNLVASAKRGNKRLIAVVLGGYSGGRRNEDAARLLEKGFSPLATISAVFRREPATVESIQNLAVAPVSLQNDVCGGKRKHPPSESDIEEDTADSQDPDNKGPKQPLLTDLPASMEPIPVSVVPSPQAQAKMVEDEAKAKVSKKKKGKPQAMEQPVEQPAAKVVAPQGGPLLPLPGKPAVTQAAVDPAASPNQSLEFAPLKSSMPQFAPVAVPPSMPAPVAEQPAEPVRRRVVAANGDAVPATSVKERPATPTQQAGKSDALTHTAQAFAPDSSIAVPPVLRNIQTEPPLQLPAIAPLPRPRPNP